MLCQRGIDAISEAQFEDGAGSADVTGVRDPIKGAASIEESFVEEGFPASSLIEAPKSRKLANEGGVAHGHGVVRAPGAFSGVTSSNTNGPELKPMFTNLPTYGGPLRAEGR